MTVDERLRLAAQRLNVALANEPIPEGPRQAPSRRIAVLATAAFAVVAGVAILATVAGRDRADLVTEATPAGRGGVALGSDHVWPEVARNATPEELAAAFAVEVLGWETPGANVDQDLDPSGPVWVRLSPQITAEPVDVLTVPTNDGGRVIIEVGVPWSSGVSVSVIEPGQDGIRVGLIRVADAVRAEVTARLDDGTLETVVATEADIQTFAYLDIAHIADPVAVRSVLVLYVDQQGRVIAATGGRVSERPGSVTNDPASEAPGSGPFLALESIEAQGGPNGTERVVLIFDQKLPVVPVSLVEQVESPASLGVSYTTQRDDDGKRLCGSSRGPSGAATGSVDLLLPSDWFEPGTAPYNGTFRPVPAPGTESVFPISKIIVCDPANGFVQIGIQVPRSDRAEDISVSIDGNQLIVDIGAPTGRSQCLDADQNISTEPDWRRHAEYREWTREGCLIRIDVLADRMGPSHCNFESVRVIITGDPLGQPYTSPSDDVVYVRDPDNAMGLADGLDLNASLPANAIDSGYRSGTEELWLNPEDNTAIYLVSPNGTERLPAGEQLSCL